MKKNVISYKIADLDSKTDALKLQNLFAGKFPFLMRLHKNAQVDCKAVQIFKNELLSFFPKAIVLIIPQDSVIPNIDIDIELYYLEEDPEYSNKHNNSNYSLLYMNDNEEEFSVIIASSSSENKYLDCFKGLEEALGRIALNYSNIVRQWNYIPNIYMIDDNGEEEYSKFNNARANAYSKVQMNFYPAATGIGVEGESAIIVVFAEKNSKAKYSPIENPLQRSAYEYSKSVLKNSETQDTEVKPLFARALYANYGNSCTIYVSGTASIRGENSVSRNSLQEQTQQTIENIESLVSFENLHRFTNLPSGAIAKQVKVFIVYLRRNIEINGSVIDMIENQIRAKFQSPDIQIMIIKADICREELLVEIEAEMKIV